MLWRQYLRQNKNILSEFDFLKIYILKIFIILSLVILSTDIYFMYGSKYHAILFIEYAVLLCLVFAYILFPRTINLESSIYIALGAVTVLIVLSLAVPAYNYSFTLFSLAIIPVYLFFFLDLRLGVYWSASVVFMIFCIIIGVLFGWINSPFSIEILIQVVVSYVALTFLIYKKEEKRGGYERELAKMVGRQEVLLKEVHHRSKNNLQVIMGLLESQALRVEDQKCKDILTSQGLRLKTMSLVHESLNNNSTQDKVEMSEYLKDIANNIENFFNCIILLKLDKLQLDMDKASNIGLFFNEAISNAAEHAYEPDENGLIEAALVTTSDNYSIVVKDFGKGFDSSSKRSSMGLTLMEDICNFFPDSFLNINFKSGTEVIATFKR